MSSIFFPLNWVNLLHQRCQTITNRLGIWEWDEWIWSNNAISQLKLSLKLSWWTHAWFPSFPDLLPGLDARWQWRLLTSHQKLRPRCIACCNAISCTFQHFCHNVKGDAPSLCMDRETYGVKPFKKTTCLQKARAHFPVYTENEKDCYFNIL